MKKSDLFYNEFRDFKSEVIETIRKHIGKNKVTFADSFKDEANNQLIAINKDSVFFDDFGGNIERYPLGELGIEDALYILTLVE